MCCEDRQNLDEGVVMLMIDESTKAIFFAGIALWSILGLLGNIIVTFHFRKNDCKTFTTADTSLYIVSFVNF